MSRAIGYSIIGLISLAVIVAIGFGVYGAYLLMSVGGRVLNPF